LHVWFHDLVERHLPSDLGPLSPDVADYVSAVLTEFSHMDQVYRIRDARGRRLDEIAQMLIESNPLLDAWSFDREREVRKHVGDLTLFLAGFFPEAIAALPRLNPLSVDTLLDYVLAGKESYSVVAAFDLFEYRNEAPLFRCLAEHFEQCVVGVRLVRQDIDEGLASRNAH
jgi:hypothetical protein